MSHTNLVLGGNWGKGEWPEFVDVGHEGSSDGRRYLPQRTPRVRGGGGARAGAGAGDRKGCARRLRAIASLPDLDWPSLLRCLGASTRGDAVLMLADLIEPGAVYAAGFAEGAGLASKTGGSDAPRG